METNLKNHIRLERHELVWNERDDVMIWTHDVPTKWWRVRFREKPPYS
jgi:hypothetical protein